MQTASLVSTNVARPLMLKFGARIRTRALQGSSDDRWPSIQIPARDTSNPLEATYKLHGSILRCIVFDWTPAALLNSLYCTSTASLHLTLLPQSSLIKHSRHTISNAVSPSSRPRRNIRPPECLLTNSPGTSISHAQHQFNPGMISWLDLQPLQPSGAPYEAFFRTVVQVMHGR